MNKKISDLADAAPLLTSDSLLVARGSAPPNLKTTVAAVLALGSAITGAGTINKIPLWTNPSNQGDSIISQLGTAIFIQGDASIGAGVSPRARLEVGTGKQWSSANLGANIVISGTRNNVIGFLDNAGGNPWSVGSRTSGLLDFSTMPALGDTSTPPVSRMTLSSGGDLTLPTGDATVALGDVEILAGALGVGTVPLVKVHVDMDAPANDDNFAGSVFLQAFNNVGAGNLGSGIVFGGANGSTVPSDGSAIIGFQDTADPDSAGLIFYTHGEAGGSRLEAMRLDSSQDATFAHWAGIGNAPTIPLDVNAKSGNTDIGGSAIKLTNKTGSPTVKGQLVIASTGTNDAFDTAGVSDASVIGIVLEAGVADGNEAWVVKSGIAEVLIDAGGATRGDRLISSTTAGSALVDNSGSTPAHFREVGHCLQTVGAGALARTDLHFN